MSIVNLYSRYVMTGLVAAIHVFFNDAMKGGWVYFMTNKRDGILGTGH